MAIAVFHLTAEVDEFRRRATNSGPDRRVVRPPVHPPAALSDIGDFALELFPPEPLRPDARATDVAQPTIRGETQGTQDADPRVRPTRGGYRDF